MFCQLYCWCTNKQHEAFMATCDDGVFVGASLHKRYLQDAKQRLEEYKAELAGLDKQNSKDDKRIKSLERVIKSIEDNIATVETYPSQRTK